MNDIVFATHMAACAWAYGFAWGIVLVTVLLGCAAPGDSFTVRGTVDRGNVEQGVVDEDNKMLNMTCVQTGEQTTDATGAVIPDTYVCERFGW